MTLFFDRTRTTLIGLAVAAGLSLTACATGSDPSADPSSHSTHSSQTSTPEASSEPIPEPVELIGGGREIFDKKRYVALYGSPTTDALGALGEQSPEESAARVKELAEEYDEHTSRQVIPSFEVIASVASAQPQQDGSYSALTPIDQLEPLLDVAEEEDIYVVLDLQPGHADFLSQAKHYESLLKRPNVGLALDPEWRLAPGQVHMQQIGSVSAAEINETAQWLADLVEENDLPQKMFVIHQFRLSMVQNREELRTDHPELAMVLHADGHGPTEDKMATWDVLQQDLPDGIRMAWKNFYHQDQPMLTPEETFEVRPRPWFVSYQ